DGAASQYGSDAIAGAINLRLKETVNQGTLYTRIGTTAKGDGTNYSAALNYGFKLNKENSFFNFTLMHQTLGETNRSDPYTGTIYSGNRQADDSTRAARGVYPASAPFRVGVFGASEVKANQFFYNAAYPVSDKWRLYSFGGISYKQALVYGFFRNAIPGNANSNPAIYPDGFTPEFPSKDRDYSISVGIDKNMMNGWNMDFSTSFGRNAVHRYARNTVNASMGADSPTDFYVGFSSFNQFIADAAISRNYKGLWNLYNASFAFGSQFRIDEYTSRKGDENSFRVGPLALTQNKAPGVQGIAATAPEDEAHKYRNNVAAFADVELDITEKWMIAGSARFENYSDFGANVSGKIATLYKVTPGLFLRSSVNRGFRAPSLQQVYNSATSTLVQAGQIRYTKQYGSDDPFLSEIGISYPRPEIATSFNAGFTFKAGKFYWTTDAYLVRVNDKIIISEALAVNNVQALKDKLEGTGIQSISFFTNHVNTITKGIDVATGYHWNFGGNQVLSLNIAATLNHTEVRDIKNTPEEIQSGTQAKVAIIDTINIALIETAQPRQKVILNIHYLNGKFQAQARATYFGKVAAWERSGGQHVVQEFGGKTLIDASLSYLLFKKLQFTIGANNLSNVYPDRVLNTLSAYGSGQSPFNRNVNQFGFSGAYYYTGLTLNF
ncbi:MAG TPA: TonB-dependent receptor, partial [Niabella sp.]|nr:TonB-dependent receptor [Niabella sp.]